MAILNKPVEMSDKKDHIVVVFFKVIGFIIRSIFPAYALIQVNQLLKRSAKLYKSSNWFSVQIKKNLILTLFVTFLVLAPISLGFLAIRGNDVFERRLDLLVSALHHHQFKDSYRYLLSAFSEKKFDLEIKLTLYLTLSGLLVSNYLVYSYDLIYETKRLIVLLKNEGIVDRDSKNPFVLFTPVGVLMDVSGSAPKEIVANERIWIAMNVKLKNDWAEDPERRSLVFFKTAFDLKNVYKYDLPDSFK